MTKWKSFIRRYRNNWRKGMQRKVSIDSLSDKDRYYANKHSDEEWTHAFQV